MVFSETSTRAVKIEAVVMSQLRTLMHSTASPMAQKEFASRFSQMLDLWDYNPEEVKTLDVKSFIDLVKQWYSKGKETEKKLIATVINL